MTSIYTGILLDKDAGISFAMDGEGHIPVIQINHSGGHNTYHINKVDTKNIDYTIKTMRATADRLEVWNELRKADYQRSDETEKAQAEYEDAHLG